VATIKFLRAVLIPVSEVLAYLTSPDNPIGAEYILMECVKGESLSSRWLSLTSDEMKDIMTQIVDMEREIFDFHFPTYTLTSKGNSQVRRLQVNYEVWL
jgi:aminoglycoside phosphotransferase (APT) family kinase protein